MRVFIFLLGLVAAWATQTLRGQSREGSRLVAERFEEAAEDSADNSADSSADEAVDSEEGADAEDDAEDDSEESEVSDSADRSDRAEESDSDGDDNDDRDSQERDGAEESDRDDSVHQKVGARIFQHRLRVCNAFPYKAAFDIYKGRHKLTDGEPLAYKKCRDFRSNLNAGDRISFMIGQAQAGVFSISDLPNNDAVLLLVISRHDSDSTAVQFTSHVFANLLNAQLAVIDTYKGDGRKAKISIQDESSFGDRKEMLKTNSVVAVNNGKYECSLTDVDGKEEKVPLVALDRESYALIRVGVDADEGKSYPEEIVVFPQSDPKDLKGSANALTMVALFAVTVLFA